ncbi:MAG TPA: hypothetical protein VMR99_01260 [Candidatus Paceibacterota bacterium]|nr:hypothetical protein [Candidatus Paceibacterota bacterium]
MFSNLSYKAQRRWIVGASLLLGLALMILSIPLGNAGVPKLITFVVLLGGFVLLVGCHVWADRLLEEPEEPPSAALLASQEEYRYEIAKMHEHSGVKGFVVERWDRGQGGPSGFLDHGVKWCVKIDGKRYHILSHQTGSLGHPTDPPHRTVVVESCDEDSHNGCSGFDNEIPSYIWEKAAFQIPCARTAA